MKFFDVFFIVLNEVCTLSSTVLWEIVVEAELHTPLALLLGLSFLAFLLAMFLESPMAERIDFDKIEKAKGPVIALLIAFGIILLIQLPFWIFFYLQIAYLAGRAFIGAGAFAAGQLFKRAPRPSAIVASVAFVTAFIMQWLGLELVVALLTTSILWASFFVFLAGRVDKPLTAIAFTPFFLFAALFITPNNYHELESMTARYAKNLALTQKQGASTDNTSQNDPEVDKPPEGILDSVTRFISDACIWCVLQLARFAILIGFLLGLISPQESCRRSPRFLPS